jgi:hypothetical protein
MASRVPPTNPAALPPPPLPPTPAGLAEVLGEGIGEPLTRGLAETDGLGLSYGYGVTVGVYVGVGVGVGVYGLGVYVGYAVGR